MPKFQLALALALTLSAGARPLAAQEIAIPFSTTRLDNGLTLILHEDHALPIVVVDISYAVGSRFEARGRSGFAHLFEHLMFMGTRRAPTKAFDAWMEAAGGHNNAWTSEDRTGYYDIGPKPLLDLFLWLEADRLRDLGPLVTQEKLDAQRDVVRNERRQTSENTPYGKVHLRLPELLYPEDHPYHHPVIGSHEDLEAATVDEVQAFFASHYRPENVSLVIAGDFDPAQARARVEAWFGSIAVPPLPAAGSPAAPALNAPLAQIVRETIEDEVELDKLVMAWRTPSHFAAGDAELDLLSAVLAVGKASRLYQKLVYEQKLAQEVEAGQDSGVLGSRFLIGVLARSGSSLERIEKAVDAVLAELRQKPISEDELTRAKNLVETSFVTRLESVAERAALLNTYQAELRDPGYVARDLARYRAVTAESMRAFAADLLPEQGRVILRVVPRRKGGDR